MTWWRHQMETFSALLATCARNSLVPGEFPAQRPVTRSFDVCFDLRLIKRLSKQSWGWWFETLPRPLWRHSNGNDILSFRCGGGTRVRTRETNIIGMCNEIEDFHCPHTMLRQEAYCNYGCYHGGRVLGQGVCNCLDGYGGKCCQTGKFIWHIFVFWTLQKYLQVPQATHL